MKDLSKKLEIAANVAIVAVAIMIAAVMVQRYFWAPAVKPPPEPPKIGSTVSIADYNWNEQPKTLVLALQTGCRYCSESAPFYKRLLEQAQQKHLKVIAVLPQPRQESEEYLQKLGITGLEVKQATLASIKVSGTPTLLFVNAKGEIANAWMGKLAPDKEAEVIDQLGIN
jgi:thioredoxin-related protein